MLNTYLPDYSVLGTGSKVKVVRTNRAKTTAGENHPSPDPARAASAVLTCDQATASAVVAGLTHLATDRTATLAADAAQNPGVVCYLRRSAMAAVLAGDTATGTSAVVELAKAVRRLPDAARRAVADEVGRLLDGSEDVIVPVRVEDSRTGEVVMALANEWLTGASVEDVAALVDPYGDGRVLYEGLLSRLRETDPAVEVLCRGGGVDVEVDEDQALAWVRRNRPDIALEDEDED